MVFPSQPGRGILAGQEVQADVAAMVNTVGALGTVSQHTVLLNHRHDASQVRTKATLFRLCVCVHSEVRGQRQVDVHLLMQRLLVLFGTYLSLLTGH